MKSAQNISLYVAGGLLIILGSVFHLAGYAPQIAMAVFGAAVIRDKRLAFLLPLLSMLISDSIREVLFQNGMLTYGGFYEGQVINYLMILSTGLLGWWAGAKNMGRITAATVAAPVMYFLVSNFQVWAVSGGLRRMMSFEGLLYCYQDALPFLRMSLGATAVFSIVFFGTHYLIRKSLQEKEQIA